MSENENIPVTREEIIKKAQSDKEFKKALVDNPKKALCQLGVQVPEDVKVKVVEESAKVVYLVLPVNPDELTDEQLDAVAGGSCAKYVHCYDHNDDCFLWIGNACWNRMQKTCCGLKSPQ